MKLMIMNCFFQKPTEGRFTPGIYVQNSCELFRTIFMPVNKSILYRLGRLWTRKINKNSLIQPPAMITLTSLFIVFCECLPVCAAKRINYTKKGSSSTAVLRPLRTLEATLPNWIAPIQTNSKTKNET